MVKSTTQTGLTVSTYWSAMTILTFIQLTTWVVWILSKLGTSFTYLRTKP